MSSPLFENPIERAFLAQFEQAEAEAAAENQHEYFDTFASVDTIKAEFDTLRAEIVAQEKIEHQKRLSEASQQARRQAAIRSGVLAVNVALL